MSKKTELLQVRIEPEMKQWLSILETKYNKNRATFIRNAIIEKFKRDTPIMRKELSKIKYPF